MTTVFDNILDCRLCWPRLLLTASLLLGGCSSDRNTSGSDSDGGGSSEADPTGTFELRSLAAELTLIEGDGNGLSIPISLERRNGHSNPVELSISGLSDADAAFLSSSLTPLTLTPSEDQSEIVLTLAIADLPLLPQQRDFIITASDGVDSDEMRVSVNVQPVDAPDVYLLVGQSNMVGFSGEDREGEHTKMAYTGGLDEPDPRIRQLNVTPNDRTTRFTDAAAFTSAAANVAAPAITTAEDPLHIPLDPYNGPGKKDTYIGLGLSFAKRALQDTSREIILVPAAWSGSSFCVNPDAPNGQWNAGPTSDPYLGNTWLFDRAVTRANLALQETGGILRGILWHQGESDANERCAPSYQQNLERLVAELRKRIVADRRGSELRQDDANIPFVVGTMSRGNDERGNLSDFPASKRQIDSVHRELPLRVTHTALSNHDDLTPANGYPCGNTTCVHFGAGALREMGHRYYEALLDAARS